MKITFLFSIFLLVSVNVFAEKETKTFDCTKEFNLVKFNQALRCSAKALCDQKDKAKYYYGCVTYSNLISEKTDEDSCRGNKIIGPKYVSCSTAIYDVYGKKEVLGKNQANLSLGQCVRYCKSDFYKEDLASIHPE